MSKGIELGTWYWLDAAPQDEWEADVQHIKHLGYDYLVLGWGGDITRAHANVAATRRMLELCERSGVGAFLCVWSGMAMYPFVGGEVNRQVDNKGLERAYYNLWNPSWRRGAYKTFLQETVRAYKDCRGLRGYLFDDTFASHSKDPASGQFVSYADEDAERFRDYLKEKYRRISVVNLFWRGGHASWKDIAPPRDPRDPFWLEWYDARASWYEAWARDTKEFIRELDRERELFLLDGGGIAANLRPWYGIDLARVTGYFDVVTLYAMPSGFDQPGVDMEPILAAADFMIGTTRQLSPGKRVAFDFHIYQPFGEDFEKVSSWPYPNLEQIKALTEQAIRSGANMVDHYGYRIGNWRLPNKSSRPMVPEIKTMLRYRTDLWEGLRECNLSIKQRRES